MNPNTTSPKVIESKFSTKLVLELADLGELSLNTDLAQKGLGIQQNLPLVADVSNRAIASSELQLTAHSTKIAKDLVISEPNNTLNAYRFGFGTATTANSPVTAVNEPIHYQNINALLSKKRWSKAPTSQGPTTVTFSFTNSASDYEFNSNYLQNDSTLLPAKREVILEQYKSKFKRLEDQSKTTTLSWLNSEYFSVSGLIFTELKEAAAADATIRIASADLPAVVVKTNGSLPPLTFNLQLLDRNHAYKPGDNVESGDVWYRSDIGSAPKIGSYGYFTIGHELGHALGLEHGHQTSPYSLTNNSLSGDRDSIEFSIMTYRTSIGGNASGVSPVEQFGYSQTLMMYDIRAMQQMYSPWFNHQATNTIYTFSSTTGEMFINGVSQGVPGANRIFRTIWDGNGVDTYNFSNYVTNLSINLEPGGWVDLHVGGNNQRSNLNTQQTGQYARAHVFNALQYQGDVRSLIENANGGSGNDVIKGNATSNTLNGNNGNDTIDGGNGNDILIGGAGNDALTGSSGNDNLLGGTGNDNIYGDTSSILGSALIIGNDTITGGDGDDFIASGGGNDFIAGDGGNDFIFGGVGNDTINGGLGNDRIEGEAGNDSILGGVGNDAVGGGTGNDIIFGDEGDDSLFGGDGNDTLTGGLGNDILYGEGGNDVIDGSSGNDMVIGTFGDTRLDGGADIDTLNFLTATNSPLDFNSYNINLATGATNYGGLVLNFENLYTNGGNDTLVGSVANNLINSGVGNDVINGGAGNDTIGGGAGNDLLYGGAGVDGFFLERTGVDTIADFAAGSSPLTNDYLIIFAGSFGGRQNLGIPLAFAGLSPLPSMALRSGAGATTALTTAQRFIFNTTDRSLYFDADGLGGAASTKIAILSNTATLSSSNFLVI